MYYQSEPRLNGVYSRYNLPDKIKDGTYVINPSEYSDIGTYWIALYSVDNNVTYFHSFGVEHIPKEIKKFIDNKNITINIFRIQAYNSVMCKSLTDLISKSLTDFANLFSPINLKKK